ncbi:hypothetical protein IPM62_01015 [Candidatus Woesebacteria bacterium]|nr:MAG: hypothetical protein IPM62_01015 [Candidatus Woesebacteria bacterium]
MNNLKFSKKYLIVSLLAIFAVLERVIFDLGPNVELITAVLILSSFYLGNKASLIFTFLALLISDLIIGNTNIYLFTWTGFLIPAVFASSVFSKIKAKVKVNKYFLTTLAGITANLFFFIWTNFGVWSLDSFGMYSNDLNGLVRCYINAIPFLKNQLISTLTFVPLSIVVFESVSLVLLKMSHLESTSPLRKAVIKIS